jgi:hypothetical protein
MAYKQDGAAFFFRHFFHFTDAFLLELNVSHGQHFVHDQDLGLEVGGHREGEFYIHAAGVAFHRGVYELLDLREGHDLVELRGDLGAFHPEDGTVEEDVFASAELGVEAGADFEQARDAAAQD